MIEAIPDTVLMLKNMGLLNHLGVVPSITFAWVPGKILRRLFFLLGNPKDYLFYDHLGSVFGLNYSIFSLQCTVRAQILNMFGIRMVEVCSVLEWDSVFEWSRPFKNRI